MIDVLVPTRDRPAALAVLLAGIVGVDHLVVFDTDTPAELLEAVKPDVYVKGGDYTPEMLPEAPHVEAIGGEIVILPYLEDRSTTGLVARIRGHRDTSGAGVQADPGSGDETALRPTS